MFYLASNYVITLIFRMGLCVMLVCCLAWASPPQTFLSPLFYDHDIKDYQAAIASVQMDLDTWISRLNDSEIEVICLGERHTQSHREFVSQSILPHLYIDQLLLEATPSDIRRLRDLVQTGEARAMHLGADMASVFYRAARMNPGLVIRGVEPTPEQASVATQEQLYGNRRRLSRDGFIAQNVMHHHVPFQRMLMLYGAHHCAKYDLGLHQTPAYRHLMNALPQSKRLSVALIEDAPLDLFSIYMDRLGLKGKTVVIADTSQVPESAYHYLWELKVKFNSYDALIYFSSKNAPHVSKRDTPKLPRDAREDRRPQDKTGRAPARGHCGEPYRQNPVLRDPPPLQAGRVLLQIRKISGAPEYYVDFCQRYPGDCVLQGDSRIAFSEALKSQLLEINIQVNRTVRFMTDWDHYGEEEYWAYPEDGIGDCEDYALEKRRRLVRVGLPSAALTMATVLHRDRLYAHAVLLVESTAGTLVMDKNEDQLLLLRESPYVLLSRERPDGSWEHYVAG